MVVTVAFVLLTAAGTAAALVSARAGRGRAYALAKVTASAGFIGVAVTSGALGATWSRILLAGLMFSAVGDGMLAAAGRRALLGGLGLFLVAYALFAAAFAVRGAWGPALAATTPIALAAAAAAWVYLRRSLPDGMRVPVAVYLAVSAAMLAAGLASAAVHGPWTLGVGVALLAGSDVLVARERFVAPGLANKLAGLPAYYLGQTLVALAVAVA